jgi:hypothetical protein
MIWRIGKIRGLGRGRGVGPRCGYSVMVANRCARSGMDQIGELEQGWSRAGLRVIVRSTLQNNQLVPSKRQHVCWYKGET